MAYLANAFAVDALKLDALQLDSLKLNPSSYQGNRTIKLSRIEPAHDNQDFEKP